MQETIKVYDPEGQEVELTLLASFAIEDKSYALVQEEGEDPYFLTYQEDGEDLLFQSLDTEDELDEVVRTYEEFIEEKSRREREEGF